MLNIVQNLTSVSKTQGIEKTDANVRKEQRDIEVINENRHKKHGDKGSPNNNTNNNKDEAAPPISIKSIILFLENFLEERLDLEINHDERENYHKVKSNISPWLKQSHSNDVQPRKAVNAYAHAAKVSRISVNKIHHSDIPELKNIYTLIKDLRKMDERGVKHLNISSNKSLINSIIVAVNNTKQL